MNGLYPTPTRLALLREVDARNVCDGSLHSDDRHEGQTLLVPVMHDEPIRRVTAAVREMESAGWVELPDGHAIWHLTAAGRAVLDAHGGERNG